ncbi:MAG: glycosyltransferase, partial [Thermodesulfovibrio sp.]
MKNILILDTGKEWGGGTNSLIELLKRIDRNKYSFTALFYYNYNKGSES